MVDCHDDPRQFTLGQLLGHVCRLVGRRRRMHLESIGLHQAQGLILFRLWKTDGISQRELAQALHITPPTATNTLQRMERNGWVERRRDYADQRIYRVYLTEKAKQLREEARASFKALDVEMRLMLTDQEHKALGKALLKVYRYLAPGGADTDMSDCGAQPEGGGQKIP
jgi:DNA-binding MarR family transcriptional regulator